MADYVHGNNLMLFLDGEALAFATSHTFSMNQQTSEISTKDHGEAAAVLGNGYTWEVTTENLYTADNAATIRDAVANRTLVSVVFGSPSNYNAKGLASAQAEDADTTGLPESWTEPSAGFAMGSGLITSFTVNANAGENATYSATITGSGALTNISDDSSDATPGNGDATPGTGN